METTSGLAGHNIKLYLFYSARLVVHTGPGGRVFDANLLLGWDLEMTSELGMLMTGY